MITLSLLIYDLILHIIKHNNKGITLKPYESHATTTELVLPSFPPHSSSHQGTSVSLFTLSHYVFWT